MYSSLLSRVTGILLPFGLRSIVRATPNSAHKLSAEIADSVQNLTLVSYGEIKREIFWISWVVLQEYKALVQVRVERSQVIQETLLSQPLRKKQYKRKQDDTTEKDKRTLARKKPANATSTKMPSYSALPSILPMNRYQLRLWALQKKMNIREEHDKVLLTFCRVGAMARIQFVLLVIEPKSSIAVEHLFRQVS